MTYINWEYYSSLYNMIPEDAFERLAKRASAKLDVYTHMRVLKFEKNYLEDTATDFQNQVHMQIQNTACELAEGLYQQETTGMGTGIASVSNDGYSESYRITTAAEQEVQLLAIVRNGLSGTGLAGAV